MEIEFQTSKEDYITFCKTQLKERLQKLIPIIVIALFFCVAAVSNKNSNLFIIALAVIGYFLLTYFLFYFIPLFVFKRKLSALMQKEPGYSEKKKWIIEKDGIRSESPSTNFLRKWESFALIKSNDEYISLILADNRFLLLPISSFASDAEVTNFLGTIQSNISIGNSIINRLSMSAKKPKPPYLIGVLCLFPLIGSVVGVMLILYGIFKYKNRWLTLIGIFGIIFSISIYEAGNYVIKHTDTFNKGFIQMDKNTLNILVKEVEFYKIQNGSYPDSLEQLKSNNLFDPLMSGSKNSQKFNYKRVGNKYSIFSSGLDQVTDTKDDIYPTILIDTNKIGLIIPHK